MFINYLKATKNLSPKTLASYSCDIKQFITYEHKVLNPDICGFISHLSSDLRLKDTSIRRKIITLKIFYDYLLHYDYLETSPFNKLKFKFKQEKKLPKTLPVAEINRLLNCFDIETCSLYKFAQKEFIRDAALIDLLISTGIRIGEAVAISRDDIITSERTVLVHGVEDIYKKIRKKGADKHKVHATLSAPYFCHEFTCQRCRPTFAQEILGHASIATTQIYTEITTNRKKQVLQKYNYTNKL